VQDQDWEEQDDQDSWSDEDGRQSSGGRRWPMMAAMGVTVLFAASAWYALFNSGELAAGATPPLIQADGSPIKVRPVDPGGLQVPDQDKLVYERLLPEKDAADPDRTARVAPAPEQPVARPTPVAPPAGNTSQADAASGTAAQDTQPTPAAPAQATPPAVVAAAQPPATQPPAIQAPTTSSTPPAVPAAPAVDRTTPSAAEPASTVSQPSPPPAAPVTATQPPPKVAAVTLPATSAPVAVPTPPAAKPSPAPAKSDTLQDVAKALDNRSKQATAPSKPKQQTAALTGPVFRIQLAASRNEKGARASWGRLQRKHGDVLGKLDLHLQKIDISGKGTFYRIQAGPFAGVDEARAACRKLKANKQDCLLVRP